MDTSTGVLSQIKDLSDLIRRVSPDTLLVVDGVCSVGGEEIHFDDMSIDVCLTASQKAIGCPPGLSILMVSEKAMNVFKSRKSPPGSYYASFKNWTPIMQNYEAKEAILFRNTTYTISPGLEHLPQGHPFEAHSRTLRQTQGGQRLRQVEGQGDWG